MSRKRDGEIEYCTRCGKALYRPPSKRKQGRPFCSRQCHMKTLNEELNPSRMTPEVRAKLRAAHMDSGEGLTYSKFLGRHTHRVVAELMLGRPLQPGEVVHHIDSDKRNNSPDNLMVFVSQAEHVAWHVAHGEGGDA
ncbi:HNH endonuclease signature motif containing protein [Flavonifractor plautii]|uniref:HNH endonuclease signature motif containing protein n=1 Tax=Flavonifractor plautii TaxID=292800 RepID=UPI003569B621